jgi:alkylation response protein AidB-like acyl-CoA dehydrogenase
VEAAIAFEQLGRYLVPGPLLWSVLASLLVPEVARGELIATGVDGRMDAPHFVEHLRPADLLLVLREDGVRVATDGIDARTIEEPFDPLTPTEELAALPDGRVAGEREEALHLSRVGTLLASSLQLGAAQASLDVAVGYALEREQFGVPIGSFQALKHIMADMYVRVGLARSATYAAAAVLDDPSVGRLDRSLAGAKLLAGEAAVDNGKAAVQILGGMGFTWEMAPHFFMKRALVLDYAFGTPERQALAISESLAREAS